MGSADDVTVAAEAAYSLHSMPRLRLSPLRPVLRKRNTELGVDVVPGIGIAVHDVRHQQEVRTLPHLPIVSAAATAFSRNLDRSLDKYLTNRGQKNDLRQSIRVSLEVVHVL